MDENDASVDDNITVVDDAVVCGESDRPSH